MASFNEAMITLPKFISNSEHIFFTLQDIFGRILKIVSFDMRLILPEHLTFAPAHASITRLQMNNTRAGG